MSSPYSVIADMQAAGWIVDTQAGSYYTATKTNTDNPNVPLHIFASSSASLIAQADAAREHRERRSLHI